jgi:hypothetical protein
MRGEFLSASDTADADTPTALASRMLTRWAWGAIIPILRQLRSGLNRRGCSNITQAKISFAVSPPGNVSGGTCLNQLSMRRLPLNQVNDCACISLNPMLKIKRAATS